VGEPRDEATDQERSVLARVGAGAAVLLAIAVVGVLLFAQSSAYRVSATFQNASQLVEGNDVRSGGVPVGTITELRLADDGQAEVTMEIEDDHAPLDRGTLAVIRQTSLSGIANRFVDLQMPSGPTGEEIDDGGEIDPDNAKAAVEIDSVVNLFDPETRRALQRFFRGSAKALEGEGDAARRGFEYLNPALASSRNLFEELASDTVLLERFMVDSAKLVTNVAARRDDLSGLVANLNATTAAAGADQGALSEALVRLPDFMRRANTTFVNLRATLDDLDPLVAASEPVAGQLREFLPELRGFARDARPTVRDLSRTIRDPGRNDDVVDLLRTFPRLAGIAVDAAERNGAERPGAFPQTADALTKAAPLIGFGRPFTVDFLGWFDDFSHTGGYDAIGGYSRSQVYVNLFSANVPETGVPELLDPQERLAQFTATGRTKQFKRCPGHSEAVAADGSNVYSQEEIERFDCDPSHRAVGP
jgi:phospholipid/cholesterol/gamma-HCH transport system substrate-binding protein